MRTMLRRPLGRSLAALTLVVMLSACHTWKPTTASPREIATKEDRIRVTRTDGSAVELENFALEEGAFVGQESPGHARSTEPGAPTVTSVLLNDIRAVEVQRVTVWVPILAALGAVALLGLFAAIMAACSPGECN